MATEFLNLHQHPDWRRQKYNLAIIAGVNADHARRIRDFRRHRYINYVKNITGLFIDPGPMIYRDYSMDEPNLDRDV